MPMTEIVKPSLSNSKINTGTGSYAYKASIFDVQLSNNMDYENIDYSGKTELINPELNEGAGSNSSTYEYTGATTGLELAGSTDANPSKTMSTILIPEPEPLTHVDSQPSQDISNETTPKAPSKAENYAKTVLGSLGSGFIKIGESIADALVMTGATIASKTERAYGNYLDSLGFHDWAQDYYDAANWVEQKSADIIGRDVAGDIYSDYVDYHELDENIAYGGVHTVTETGATIAGYVAIGAATSGTGLMPIISAASAGGSAAEKAFQNDASFNEAAVNTGAAAIVGYASGYGLDKLGIAARGATSIPQVLGYTGAGALVGAATPAATSAVEYSTYGKDRYDSYHEYAKATGTYKSMAIGGAVGGTIVGIQAGAGYAKAIKNGRYAQYDTYEEYVERLRDNRKAQDQINRETNGRLEAILDEYTREDLRQPGNYKLINGTLRGDFELDEAGNVTKVTLRDSTGRNRVLTAKEFKKQYRSLNSAYKDAIDAEKFISDNISKCTLGENMQLVRGVSMESLAQYGITSESTAADITKALKKAGYYTEPGYMSCCPNYTTGDMPYMATTKEAKLILNVKGDTNAFDLSRINSVEREILLDKGLFFKPKKAIIINGQPVIYLDQV